MHFQLSVATKRCRGHILALKKTHLSTGEYFPLRPRLPEGIIQWAICRGWNQIFATNKVGFWYWPEEMWDYQKFDIDILTIWYMCMYIYIYMCVSFWTWCLRKAHKCDLAKKMMDLNKRYLPCGKDVKGMVNVLSYSHIWTLSKGGPILWVRSFIARRYLLGDVIHQNLGLVGDVKQQIPWGNPAIEATRCDACEPMFDVS